MSVTIAASDDAGKSWLLTPIAPDDDFFLEIYNGKASFSFISPEHGFALLRCMSSTAYSSARLYETEDAGKTWKDIAHPVFGKITFLTPYTGWLVGGVGGSHELYQTTDGGRTWEEREIPLPQGVERRQDVDLAIPYFSNLQNGSMQVSYQPAYNPKNPKEQKDQLIAFYVSNDGGKIWMLESPTVFKYPAAAGVNIKTLNHSSPPQLSLSGPCFLTRTSTSVHQTFLPVTLATQEPLTIHSADFSNSANGWVILKGDFQPLASRFGHSDLIATADAGASWKVLLQDNVKAAAASASAVQEEGAIQDIGGTTQPVGWFGLDSCSPNQNPSVMNAYYWGDYPVPFAAFGSYLEGGYTGDLHCFTPDSTYIFNLACSDWAFVPIGDHFQAPCANTPATFRLPQQPGDTNYLADAADYGRTGADWASDSLDNLGLTGSIAYLDVELYAAADQVGGSVACSEAVEAYVNAYVQEMHVRGNYAGVYGSKLNIGDDLLPGTDGLVLNVPDDIWVAWTGPPFLYPLPPIPDWAWIYDQRSRQFVPDIAGLTRADPNPYDFDNFGSQLSVLIGGGLENNCVESWCTAQCWQGNAQWCGSTCLACTVCSDGLPPTVRTATSTARHPARLAAKSLA